MSARDAHCSLSLQAAGDFPGVRLVGCGAGTDLTAIIITPCIDLEGQEGRSGKGRERSRGKQYFTIVMFYMNLQGC